MLAEHRQIPSKQGSAISGWIVLDYGNIKTIFIATVLNYFILLSVLGSLIVHVMTPQLRNFYKLERRWKDAEIYDFNSFLEEISQEKPKVSDQGSPSVVDDEDWSLDDVSTDSSY